MTHNSEEEIILKDSLVKAIGKITIYHNELEKLIKTCINILIGGEGATTVTATKMGFTGLLDLLSALYRQKLNIQHNEDSPSNLKELVKAARDANDQRNIVNHSIWSVKIDDTEKPFVREKRDVRGGKLKTNIRQLNINELNVILLMIKDAIDKARKFTQELLMSYITSPISPADRAIFSDDKPEFTWMSVKGAVGYELVLTSKYPYIDHSISKMGVNLIRDTQYRCEAPLEQKTTYYWMVRPIIANVLGYWSEIRSFSIE